MSLSFVTKPTEEEKKIRKLKYNIFVNGKVNNPVLGSGNEEENTGSLEGSWAFVIVDINENKTVIDAKEENTNELKIELTGIIESLKWISNHTEQKYKKFVQIILHTSSIYCYNLLNEWIELWTKDETISQRAFYKYYRFYNSWRFY